MPLFSSLTHHTEVHKWHSCGHKGYRHWIGKCPEPDTCKRLGFGRNHVRFVHHQRFCKNCRYHQRMRGEGAPENSPPAEDEAPPEGAEAEADSESEEESTGSESETAVSAAHGSNHGATR